MLFGFCVCFSQERSVMVLSSAQGFTRDHAMGYPMHMVG